MITLAENIKRMRIWRGVSQESLAECLNITPQAVSRWESGKTLPDITMLPSIAGYFGVSIDKVLGYDPSAEARQAALLEISDSMSRNTAERSLEICREKLALYPSDYIIMLMTATNLFSYALSLGKKSEEYRTYLNECMAMAERVINEAPSSEQCKDCPEMLVLSARMLRIRCCDQTDDYSRALEDARIMPNIMNSRDMLLPRLLPEAELPAQLKETSTQLGALFAAMMTAGKYERGKSHGIWDFSLDECRRMMAALDAMYALTDLIDARADSMYQLFCVIYANRLAECGYNDEAIERLFVVLDSLELYGDIMQPSMMSQRIRDDYFDGKVGLECTAELLRHYIDKGSLGLLEGTSEYEKLMERFEKI